MVIRRRVDRYLRATRTDFSSVSLSEAEQMALRQVARRGLPDLDNLPAFHGMTSRQRRWEYLRAGVGDEVLVIDLALEDALVDLQHLMLPKPQVAAPALAWVYAADAFRHEGVFDAYHLFARSALDHGEMLEPLAALRSRRRDLTTRHFLLFHELGHIAIERQLPWTEAVRRSTRLVLDGLVKHIEDRLSSIDGNVPNFVHGAGKPMEAFSGEERRANLEQYRDVACGAESLIEEASCDLIAALALASLPAGQSYLGGVPTHAAGTWRMAADSLFLSARLVRLLGFLAGMQQLAKSFAPGFPPFHNSRYQIELSLRFNIVVNTAMAFNRDVLAELDFAGGSGFDPHVSRDAIVNAFDASIVRDGRLFDSRIFSLYEVIEPAREPEQRIADLTLGSGPLPPEFDHLRAGDQLRAEIDRDLQKLVPAAHADTLG